MACRTIRLAVVCAALIASATIAVPRAIAEGVQNPALQRTVTQTMRSLAAQILGDYYAAKPHDRRSFPSAGDLSLALQVFKHAPSPITGKTGEYSLKVIIETGGPHKPVHASRVSGVQIVELDGTTTPIYFFNALAGPNESPWDIDLTTVGRSSRYQCSYTTATRDLFNAYDRLTEPQFAMLSKQATLGVAEAKMRAPIQWPEVWPITDCL